MQAAMPSKDMATSTATVGLLRQLGSTIGVSIGQAIWSSVSYSGSLGDPLTSCIYNTQELRSRLTGVQGLTIDTSSAGLADSVRQLKNIQVHHSLPSSGPISLINANAAGLLT
jgi:hypothetical protein